LDVKQSYPQAYLNYPSVAKGKEEIYLFDYSWYHRRSFLRVPRL